MGEMAGERWLCVRLGQPISLTLSPLVPPRAREAPGGSAQMLPSPARSCFPAFRISSVPDFAFP